VRLSVTLEGAPRARKRFTEIEKATYEQLARALYYEGEAIMADSKINYVPVRTGTLRSSGFVRPPKFEDGKWTVELGYGGAAQTYAIIIHERPWTRKSSHWSKTASGKPGQNKYLEKPLLKRASKFDQRLAAWVKVFNSGVGL
jgi:hypothetical protein